MEIKIGGFVDPLHKQLDVPPSQVQIEQDLADAYTMLRIYGIVTPDEGEKIAERLIKLIKKTLQK